MSAIARFLETARRDEPVYICDVRDAFQKEGARPFHFHLRLYDGGERRFALSVPECADAEEKRFVEEYLNAALYNALSALGAREIAVYIDLNDVPMAAYAARLDGIFQVDAPISERGGYGKCMNVNQRTLNALCGPEARFRFRVMDISKEPGATGADARDAGQSVFSSLPRRTEVGMWMGMDIGGTDVKLVAALDGRLCAFKEYDWFPAGFTRAAQLIEPLRLLTRLMRSAACMAAAGLGDETPQSAFDRSAGEAEVLSAIEGMEARLGDRLRGFDGIGLCFPDVVIRNRVVGGETPKTQGMRENAALDYEAEFSQITNLCDALREYVVPGGAVRSTNDGPMAAFTTAVEQAAAGRDLSEGCFAHSLGTDLGTGWILPDGSIPEIPLEIYNVIVDLGSHGQRAFDAGDVRSVRSFNTGLPGTLQKYANQTGVFRLAAKRLPGADPELYRGAFERGLFRWEGTRLVVPSKPEDRRKPCLEYFMNAVEEGNPACEAIFRELGEALGAAWRETDYILGPACKRRTLFGRLVKTPACFERICEGARRVAPDIALEVADDGLANTDLMRQLANHPAYTVAQFGQAVGAVYFAGI